MGRKDDLSNTKVLLSDTHRDQSSGNGADGSNGRPEVVGPVPIRVNAGTEDLIRSDLFGFVNSAIVD